MLKDFCEIFSGFVLCLVIAVFMASLSGCAGRVTPVSLEAKADNGSTAIINLTIAGSSFGFNSPQSATPDLGSLGGITGLVPGLDSILPAAKPAVVPPLAPVPEVKPPAAPAAPVVTDSDGEDTPKPLPGQGTVTEVE